MLKKEFGDLRSLDFIRLQAIKKLSEVLSNVSIIFVNKVKIAVFLPMRSKFTRIFLQS